MYKVLIRPVLTDASETWTLSKTNERQPSLFERNVLRCNVFLERSKKKEYGENDIIMNYMKNLINQTSLTIFDVILTVHRR